MKKIILLLFSVLLVFSLASARSIDISINKKEITANSEIAITYKINFDEVETFDYQVGIKGNDTFILVNKSATDDSVAGTVVWNTKNYPAGEYEAFVFIPPSTYWPSSKFKILPFMDFNVSAKSLDFFVYGKSMTKSFEIKNLGNVPIFVSVSPNGLKSESSVVPITSTIDVNSSVNFLVSIEKPSKNYNATFNIEASWNDLSNKIEIPVNVYNPNVIINVENVSLSKIKNLQAVTGVILNKGNVYRNLTFVFHTDKGDNTSYKIIKPNESLNLNYTFPLDEKINSLEIRYIGSDGKEKIIKKDFSILSSLNIPFKFNINYLYAFVGLLVLISLFYLIRRRKKPSEKIDLQKLNSTLGR